MADSGGGTKVGSIFYESSIDGKGFEKGAGQINQQIEKLRGSFNSLNPTVRAVGLSLGAYIGGRAVLDFFKSTIVAANEQNRVMAQTEAVINSTGGAAGLSAQKIGEMATEIQRTTNVSDEAAQSGMNMLLTFTKIGSDIFPQATQAMLDMATAMNGGITPSAQELQGTAIQLGKALQDPILGMTALRRVGVNFNEAQQEMVKNMVESGDQMKAQKFILQELANEFGGSAAAQARTFEGQILQLQNSFSDFKEEIGNAVIPALTYLVSALSGGGSGLTALLVPIKAVASGIIVLVSLFRMLGMTIGAVFGGVISTMKGGIGQGIETFKKGMTDVVVEGARTGKALSQVWGKEADKQAGIFKGGAQEQIDASGAKGKKIAQDLEKETDKFRDEMAKRKRAFEENLAQLIWAHQDKVKELKKDLEEENTSFRKSMAERKAEFDKSITELTTQLGEETKEHEDKTAKIQALIDKELSYGKNARQSKIRALQEELVEEMATYDERALEIQTKIDEESAVYALQTTKLTEQNALRLTDIQTKLTEEEAILAQHAGLVASIKDKTREDDIARLVRQHQEENVEAEKQHSQRMIDIVEQGAAAGGAGGGAFADSMNDAMSTLASDVDQATKDMAANMAENIAAGAMEAGKALIRNFLNTISDRARELKGSMGGALVGMPGIGQAISAWAALPRLATGATNFGGGMALVGEQGPELVHLPKGTDVYSNNQSKDMAGSTVNIYVERIASDIDIDSLAREIGFRTGLQPR